MQFMSSTSVNCIEEMRLPMPMLLLLLRLLAKNFLAISNSNVEKRAERAGGRQAVRTEKTLCLTVWLIACHAHARTPTVAEREGEREGATTIDVATTATGMPGYRMQDTGHFWAGTADIAYFSAHTEICSSPGREWDRGSGARGICNDADNDLKFIKNSKICVAKNMQLEGRGRRGGEGRAVGSESICLA